MMLRHIQPCLPSKAPRPPSGPLWVHEIKYDGYRLMVRREGARVWCFTKNGHDWADRFPGIVAAAHRIRASSFLLDGESVIPRADGMPDFNALRSQSRNHEALLYAFDLIAARRRRSASRAADRAQAAARATSLCSRAKVSLPYVVGASSL